MSDFISKHKPRSSRGFAAMLDDTVSGKLCFIQTKDSTGYDAFYFLVLLPEMEEEFKKIIPRPGGADLSRYGVIVSSGYGRTPHQASREKIRELFDLDVETLIANAKKQG